MISKYVNNMMIKINNIHTLCIIIVFMYVYTHVRPHKLYNHKCLYNYVYQLC